MQKRRGLFLTAFIFFILSFLTILIFRIPFFSGVTGAFELLMLPAQRSLHSIFGGMTHGLGSRQQKLQNEYRKLKEQLSKQKSLENEVKALRDQFQTAQIPIKSLLPATIVGTKGLIPGISQPSELIIDKGTSDSVESGYVVIYENNLVGKITKVSPHLSLVRLLTDTDSSLTGRTSQTNALGIVNGGGNGVMVFDNVILSEKLTVSDVIVTKGDLDTQAKGYPPDLIIGKIVSVDKKASSLFQTAKVQSLLEIPKLTTVFVLLLN